MSSYKVHPATKEIEKALMSMFKAFGVTYEKSEITSTDSLISSTERRAKGTKKAKQLKAINNPDIIKAIEEEEEQRKNGTLINFDYRKAYNDSFGNDTGSKYH